ETEKVATDKLKDAHVFARILSRAAQSMERAAARMQEVREKPEEHLTDAETARLQREALRRLDQLLDALKQDKGMAGGGGQQGGDDGGGQGGQGGPRAPQDGIPHLAQLKALRALQKEVNERTETFNRDHPDAKKLTPAQQGELLDIKKDQRDVGDLLDEL